MDYKIYNEKYLTLLSDYLNNHECIITENMINKVCNEGVNDERAFLLLFNQIFLDSQDYILKEKYLPFSFYKLNQEIYKENPYYKNITFNNYKYKKWVLKKDKYRPYQGFVCNDFRCLEDGRIIPQIGYFDKPFHYLAIYQNQRMWMSITPNEIETMKEPINMANGNVLTFGLGLGYFAYMVSLKECVNKVIIVEKDNNVIDLFKNVILPQFRFKDKILIINEDAFTFLNDKENLNEINFVFCDIWHDVEDGLDLYLKFKHYENDFPDIKFTYWIEKTIKAYL